MAAVARWKSEDVAEWLEECLQLPYGNAFREAGIDGQALIDLDREQLTSIGVAENAHILRVLSHVSVFRSQLGRPLRDETSSAAPKGSASHGRSKESGEGRSTGSRARSTSRSGSKESGEGRSTGSRASASHSVPSRQEAAREAAAQAAPVARVAAAPSESSRATTPRKGQAAPKPAAMPKLRLHVLPGRSKSKEPVKAAEGAVSPAIRPPRFTQLMQPPSRQQLGRSSSSPRNDSAASCPQPPRPLWQDLPARVEHRQPCSAAWEAESSSTWPSWADSEGGYLPGAVQGAQAFVDQRLPSPTWPSQPWQDGEGPEEGSMDSDSLAHPLFAGSGSLEENAEETGDDLDYAVVAAPPRATSEERIRQSWEDPELQMPSREAAHGDLAQVYFPPSPPGSTRELLQLESPPPSRHCAGLASPTCVFPGGAGDDDIFREVQHGLDGSQVQGIPAEEEEAWRRYETPQETPEVQARGDRDAWGHWGEGLRKSTETLDLPHEEFSFLGVPNSCSTTTTSSSAAVLKAVSAPEVATGSCPAVSSSARAFSAVGHVLPREEVLSSCATTPRSFGSKVCATMSTVQSEFGVDSRRGPSFTSRPKRPLVKPDGPSPGPGFYVYDRGTFQRKGVSKFSVATRETMLALQKPRATSPGGGHFRPPSAPVRGGKFDLASRWPDQQRRREKSPGPGGYMPRHSYLSTFK
eukprot:TRINITY_DN3277_c0_g1_i1.p1 TRINITY_DN3277_c0_g1~~TRINITY_DN3277_c0_g1_i1.p1  ORF type:complete len:695 (+),score=99.51 TRINITY_DN3277_c0_g1_i1:71-2155(+)